MAENKNAWAAQFHALADEVRGNRKLQYGLLAIAAIVAVELGLDWSDAIAARERRLQDLRAELRQLRGQSRDETALKATLADVEGQQAAIEKRLWTVSSDPVGQARLKDWLTGLAKETGAKEFKLVLATPRAVGDRVGERTGERGADENNAQASGLREFRADISFVFTPETLERMLYAIESGDTLASVESLSVAVHTRKAELGVSVVMRLGQLMDADEAARAAARLGEAAGQNGAAGAEAPTAVPAAAPATPPAPAAPQTAPTNVPASSGTDTPAPPVGGLPPAAPSPVPAEPAAPQVPPPADPQASSGAGAPGAGLPPVPSAPPPLANQPGDTPQ